MLNPLHQVSGLSWRFAAEDREGSSLATQRIAAAAMLDGLYSRKLASVQYDFFLLEADQCTSDINDHTQHCVTFDVGEYNFCGMGAKEPQRGS